MAAVKAEQFTLFDIPANEPKRVRTKWEELQEMAEEGEKHGGFIPQFIAAVLLDVSKARVGQLVEDGRLKRYTYFGKPFVTVDDVSAFINSERKTGRPVGNPPATLKESFTRVNRYRKEKP